MFPPQTKIEVIREVDCLLDCTDGALIVPQYPGQKCRHATPQYPSTPCEVGLWSFLNMAEDSTHKERIIRMTAGLQISVDQALVEPIVRAEIEAAIVAQLNNVPDLVSKLVQAAMADKVDENGRKGQYSSDNKYLFIDVLCQTAIQNAAREAMKQYITDHSAELQDEIRKQIEKQKSGLAKAFVESLVGAVKVDWRFKVGIGLDGQ